MIESIENIQNSKKEPLGASGEAIIANENAAIAGLQGIKPLGKAQNDSSSNEAYDISLSDEAWESLDGDKKEAKESNKKERDSSGNEKLDEEKQRKVDELKKIDRKVHVHEQAHVSAGGAYVRGGANYSYVTGPDGKRYANAGHVNIDVSPEKEPEATIRKADVVRRAALAPSDPSPADRQIAAQATSMAQDAQREIANGQTEQANSSSPSNSSQGAEFVAAE